MRLSLVISALLALALGCFALDAEAQFGGMMWKPPPAIAGTPPDVDPSGAFEITGATGAMVTAVNTTNSSDILAVCILLNSASAISVTGISSPNTTAWNLRRTAGAAAAPIELWYGKAASPLVAEDITITANAGQTFFAIALLPITGADTVQRFDPNVALPSSVNSGNATVTTTNANTMPLACYRGNQNIPGQGAGWTADNNKDFLLMEHQRVSSAQSGLSATYAGGETIDGGIADAVTQ